MVFIYVILIIVLVNTLFMLLYCRFARKMDQRYFDKRNMQENNIGNQAVGNNANALEKPSGMKEILKKLYAWGNSYIYGLMRYNLILVGKIPSHKLRHFIYKYIYCMKLGRKAVIYGGCEIRSPWNIEIGNAVIAVGCLLDGREKITIGDNVVLGSGIRLWTEEHDLNDPLFRVTPDHSRPIVIEDYAWICSDSTILPGIHIGKGAVVAARACVTKDCEPYGVYGGVPAKKISERNRNLTYELNGKPTWHFY